MLKKSRSHERKPLSEFGFIQIPGDDGGQILNISEAGLCFATFVPLGQVKNVQFWFSLNLRDRIEATGEVAWLDAETKTGGLRFLNPTERALKHIRAYATAFPSEESSEKGRLFAAPLASDSVRSIFKSDAPLFKSGIEDSPALRQPDDPLDKNPPLPATVESTDLISLQRHYAVCRRQLNLGILIGVLASASVAIPIGYFGYRSRIHSPHSSIGTAAPEAASSEAGPAHPISATTSALPPPNLSGAMNAQRSIATHSYPNSVPKDISPVSSSPFSEGNQGPGAASRAVQLQEGDAGVARKSGATPQQLWAAVQAGDANAAVLLADRYLRGDGVPVNCVQARVLLLAASEKNNAAAIKKLHDLDKNGCP